MTPNEHFTFDQKKQKLELTGVGRQLMRYSNPPAIGGGESSAMDKLQERVEQALQAHYRFRRDQHYMLEKGKVVIIDEFTGRKMPDRQWRDGLHQAVEAKEGVMIHKMSDHAAQVTFQSYFRLYKKLAGMTGTAAQNRWEIAASTKSGSCACRPTSRWSGSTGPTASFRRRTPSSRRWCRRCCGCGAGPVGADRHAVGGQVGEAERAAAGGGRGASGAERPPARTRRRRSWPRRARPAG